MQEKNKKTIILLVCAITIVLAGALGTYAYFVTSAREEKQELTVTLGTLALTFEDNSDGITRELTLGESISKEFKIRNTGTEDVTTNMLFGDMVNTYLSESLSYTLEYRTSEDGEWTGVETVSQNVPRSETASDKNLAKDLTIPAGETYYYKLTITFNNLDDVDQTQDIGAIFTSKFKIGDTLKDEESLSEETLKYLNLTVNEGIPNYAEPATTDEGVFALEDDYGTSYYYRGAVTNNYVKFAGFYWRIIRINGDGSLRIIYDGLRGYANGTEDEGRLAYTEKAFNAKYDDNKYVGWMFGGAQGTESTSKAQAQTNETDSDLKTLVDSWYKTNIEDKSLGDKVADVIFCNDRSTPGKEETGYLSDTGLGYGKNSTAYGATARMGAWNKDLSTVQPRFTCPQKNDAFTVSDETKGNGDLAYPVGLITTDETIAAGSGKNYEASFSFYLYKGKRYWLFSPYYYYGSYAGMFYINGGFGLSYVNETDGAGAGGVAPVINLKAEYVKTMIGDGTINDPYRDVTDTV